MCWVRCAMWVSRSARAAVRRAFSVRRWAAAAAGVRERAWLVGGGMLVGLVGRWGDEDGGEREGA